MENVCKSTGLLHPLNLSDLKQMQGEGTIVPADMELEISAVLAVTDGGATEMLMVSCIKALLQCPNTG